MTSSWRFPLTCWAKEIPQANHPGSFGFKRKHDIHTGVDLYTEGYSLVYAVEDGEVVAVEDYTGPTADSPWWLPTKAILVEGESGVVCYGEVEPKKTLKKNVVKGQCIAEIRPVLPPSKQRSDIKDHSRFMLHMELYKQGTTESVWWYHNQEKPENLLDPTDLLKRSLTCQRSKNTK